MIAKHHLPFIMSIVMSIPLLFGGVFYTGCQSGKEKARYSSKSESFSPAPEVKTSSRKEAEKNVSETNSRNSVRSRNGRNSNTTSTVSSSTASTSSTSSSNPSSKKSVSTTESSGQSLGSQTGNIIVEKARQESGTVDPKSRESQMADHVSQTIAAPKTQTKKNDDTKRTSGQELEDIGEKCLNESLRRAFNSF